MPTQLSLFPEERSDVGKKHKYPKNRRRHRDNPFTDLISTKDETFVIDGSLKSKLVLQKLRLQNLKNNMSKLTQKEIDEEFERIQKFQEEIDGERLHVEKQKDEGVVKTSKHDNVEPNQRPKIVEPVKGKKVVVGRSYVRENWGRIVRELGEYNFRNDTFEQFKKEFAATVKQKYSNKFSINDLSERQLSALYDFSRNKSCKKFGM